MRFLSKIYLKTSMILEKELFYHYFDDHIDEHLLFVIINYKLK